MKIEWLKFASVFFIASTAFAEMKFTVVDGEATGVAPALRAWQERSGNPKNWWSWGVTAWDQDGDGKQDLILTTHQSSPLTGSIILRGDGTGKFRDVTAELGLAERELPHEYRPVPISLDRPGGAIHLLHSTQGTGRIVVNEGSRLRLGGTTFDLSSKAGHVADLNADNYPDFIQLARDYGTTSIQTFVNDQKGGFIRSSVEQPILLAVPEDVVERLIELRSDTNVINRYCGPKFWHADLDGDRIADVAMQYAGSYANQQLRDHDGNPATPKIDIAAPYRIGWYSVDLGIPPETIPLDVRDVTGDGVADVFAGYGSGGGLYVGGKLVANADLNKTLSLASPPYLTKLEWHDFDKDGDDDLLVSTQRLGWLEIYENAGDRRYIKCLRAHHWNAEGYAVADFNGDGMLDVAVGGTGPVRPVGWPHHRDANFTLYLNAAVPPPPPFVVKLRHPLETADPQAPEAKRFLVWCDLPNPFGLDAFRLALAYRISGEKRYAERAAAMVNTYVATANDEIAAGRKPAIARNSYLNVFRETRAILFPLEWCGNEFTSEEKDAAESLCRQAVWNIWHATEATWGGKPHSWSGWATSDPENNYHFAFVGATTLVELSGRKPGDGAQYSELFQRIASAHDYCGGGSREGTGYGLSHATLFEVFGIWLASTGEHFPAIEQHARDSIAYWVHATAPGHKYVATIGDQARKSDGATYDYHRATILWARRLGWGRGLEAGQAGAGEGTRLGVTGSEGNGPGDSWLAAYPQMKNGFNFYDDLVPK